MGYVPMKFPDDPHPIPMPPPRPTPEQRAPSGPAKYRRQRFMPEHSGDTHENGTIQRLSECYRELVRIGEIPAIQLSHKERLDITRSPRAAASAIRKSNIDIDHLIDATCFGDGEPFYITGGVPADVVPPASPNSNVGTKL